jgi:RsiW-degrading membrane proteinase PrsW (M82 family)
MHRLGILFCAIVPSLVLLQYGIAKARARWDDRVIWEAFFGGGITTIFVLLPEMLLKRAFPIDGMSPVHGAVLQAFVIAAIPEEIAKFAAIFYAIKRFGDGNDWHDVITTSFAVALGFAAIENLVYLLAPGEWQLLAASRAVLAVPMHGLDGLAMGSFLTMAQFNPRKRRIWLTAALAVPVLLHAGYDFPLMLITKNEAFFGVLPAWFFMVVLSTICVLCLCNKVRALTERSHIPLDGASSRRLSGAVLLLLVPILAGITLISAGSFGIVGAAAFSILPTILGIDLLWTSSKVSPAATARR